MSWAKELPSASEVEQEEQTVSAAQPYLRWAVYNCRLELIYNNIHYTWGRDSVHVEERQASPGRDAKEVDNRQRASRREPVHEQRESPSFFAQAAYW